MKLFLLLLFCTFTTVLILSFNAGDTEKQEEHYTPEQLITTGKKPHKEQSVQKGLYIIPSKKWLSERIVEKLLKKSRNRSGFVVYNSQKAKKFTASAPGTDKNHHIVNSYLKGYAPFKTTNPFVPWLTLAKKKEYMTDLVAHNGMEDIWQNSYQAYKYTRGDCEDHAIALSDWLISMGYDARVVIGKHKGGGHAWVVLINKGKTYLLEATQKRGVSTLRKFPLAKTKTQYQPMYMFNRKLFWKNNGTFFTTSYRSKNWKKMSRYTIPSSL